MKPNNAAVPERVGAKGAARYLDLAESSIRRLGDTGVIPCLRDYSNRRTFLITDLEAYKAKAKGSRQAVTARQRMANFKAATTG